MEVLYGVTPIIEGRVQFFSKVKNNDNISIDILYFDTIENVNYEKMTYLFPKCILINEIFMFSHIVSIALSKGCSVAIVSKAEMRTIDNNEHIVVQFQEQLLLRDDNNLLQSLNLQQHYPDILLGASVKTKEEADFSKENNISYGSLILSEYLLLHNKAFDEDAMYRELNAVCKCFSGVCIRLFDFDTIKTGFLETSSGKTLGFSGLRGVRSYYQPESEELIRRLSRVIASLSEKYNIKVLIPFVSNIEDIRLAKRILEDEGVPKDIPIGAMIETPLSFIGMDIVFKHVDFLSIGTNDLIQFFCAADRDNPGEHGYIYPYALPFIRLLNNTVADKQKISICGQLPLYPRFFEILLGMGFNQFSLPARTIPFYQRKVKTIKLEQCYHLLQRCLRKNEWDCAPILKNE